MRVIKVAQLFSICMHFAVELAEVYINYSGEYVLELVKGS